VRFLIDAQLPPALARHLAAQEHDAQHVLMRTSPRHPIA
jgi:hypothetical protein